MLLDQLHKNRLAGSSLFIEEIIILDSPSSSESSMESTANPLNVKMFITWCVPLARKLTRQKWEVEIPRHPQLGSI